MWWRATGVGDADAEPGGLCILGLRLFCLSGSLCTGLLTGLTARCVSPPRRTCGSFFEDLRKAVVVCGGMACGLARVFIGIVCNGQKCVPDGCVGIFNVAYLRALVFYAGQNLNSEAE